MPVYTTGTTSGTLGYTSEWTVSPTWNMNIYNYEQGLNPGYDAPDYDNVVPVAGSGGDAAGWGGDLVIPRAALADDIAEIHRYADQQRRSRTAANDRAAGLLLSLLTPQQQQSYRETGSFEVIGSAGGRYRINKGTAGNVEWFDPATGRVAAKLCAHPSMRHDEGWLPESDVAVGQMLALTTDEPGFVQIANVHAGRRPTFERTWRNRLRVA